MGEWFQQQQEAAVFSGKNSDKPTVYYLLSTKREADSQNW